ncbi:MAG TPA: carboxypeptidase-like regulatory domain-containing protein [Terracidiphilus sp.]|nr:carboxypeptidase-like regulatory domain-containing protein [Terracidiphilus sp.]
MRNPFVRVLVLTVLVLFTQVQSKAQTVASITGVVSDPTEAVIPGVSVTLTNPQTNASYQTVSNSVGSYLILNVKPGPGYKISFSRDGFNPVTITDLYLNVDSTRTQNAQLVVGSAAQTVEVSASNQDVTLNTTDATVGNSVEVQYLNNLPVQNRDRPSALFTEQPGTTLDGSVTGSRTDQSNVTVDGLDVNDIFTGNFGSIAANAPVDSIQEFRGVSAGQPASSGKGGGGQYSLVTKSGTNKFHGNVNEYHRDTDTQANDWFNNDHGVPRPPLIRNQFGGNIGGPIKRDKAFFFFNWDSRRDTLSNLVERTVPTDAYKAGTIVYYTNYANKTTANYSAPQITALDPQGKGFNSSVLSVFSTRYPKVNDLTGAGDHINTGGFKFNAPFPYVENNYVGKVDYNLTTNQKIWGKVGFSRIDQTQKAIEFPGDPETYPFLDKSYQWVVGHTWAIGSNKSNQAWYGTTVTNWNFPNTYNPTGANQYSFGGTGTGGVILSGPYASAINAQNRIVPIPVIGDDFGWQKGRHNFQMGGTFKYINPDSNTILDYNSPTLGLGGNMNTLNASLRPANIDPASSTARSFWDRAFTLALGRFGSTSATYNYDNKGGLLPQGTGSQNHYRFFETELYFSDSWRLTPSLTISYGLRWQNYSSPYEKNGIQSIPSLNFDQYFSARAKQSAAGLSGDSSLPFISYSLGGKTNNSPGYFQPDYKNFGPRLGFAYSPGVNSKSVFSGSAGVVFDYTVVSAVMYQAEQYSYLFQSSATLPLGTPANPTTSLLTDPRFSGFTATPPLPTAPTALKAPYTPFVSGGVPTGLSNGSAFNEAASNNLKTPYNIMLDFGFQHEFPAGFILKTTYVGRLGRRLLGQADADQLIDFPDLKSGQMMSTAFANIAKQRRAQDAAGLPCGVAPPVTEQPWFEDVITPGVGAGFGFASNSDLIACGFDPLPLRGDFADTIQGISTLNQYSSFFGVNELFPSNIGMGSQFSELSYYTNKGFSNYHGLLVTLHKNAGHGIQFDINYTWSHSIDNVSVIANAPAIGGYGFICDVVRPRNCRGNSDFDVTQYVNGQFLWQLPVGRGREFAATAPFWVNEVIGGWDLSGLPYFHTGNATFASSNAFVAGYANDAPAILTGSVADLNSHVHKAADGTVWAFKKSDDSYVNDFVGPVGFQVGSRNNLRGPHYFDLDLGLAKTFPILADNKLNLIFRCDAYNALNHPSFSNPSALNNLDITESSATFGILTSTASTARVLQGALRLEF